MSQGKVYLVGAGPGASDLLTMRAVRLLERADTVLYDRLVGPEIMDLIGPRAERIYVGVAPGEDGRKRQNRIHTLMIGHASMGRTVVRLKGGDPFVFGRGGEELLELSAAGIDAEVVPGISSSLAAPASALIPVTHRGTAISFGVFSAQAARGALPKIDWRAAAGMDTAVFLMGVERLPVIVDYLTAYGRSPETPVAVIEKATRPDMRVVTGILADITELAHDIEPPATIVVGDVVNVRPAVLERRNTVPAYAV
ncbi:MAG: uroporphyrinogen-III C-methyltransferase [Acidobacteriota bacterium]|nr:uroporphyrinogen-III C-methyltransferase [Acidobacteriota bacterium]